ncbi:MltR family transcriptional regulator [Pedobacter sp.]
MSKSKKRQEIFKKFVDNDTNYWDDFLVKELNAESDRGSVILACSLFDIALKAKIKSFLVHIENVNDDIFDDANSPLSTFSAKINMAYRLGIVSNHLKSDLHTLRDIRNSFAHNIDECSFDDTEVINSIEKLKTSSKFIERFEGIRNDCFPSGYKGDFIMFASMLLSTLKSEYINQLEPATAEWVYNQDYYSPE